MIKIKLTILFLMVTIYLHNEIANLLSLSLIVFYDNNEGLQRVEKEHMHI